jgi:hypothetical protein
MFSELLDASLYQPNPFLLSPALLQVALGVGLIVVPLILLVFLVHVVILIVSRTSLKGNLAAQFSIVMAASFGLTLALHWLAFMVSDLLLPKDRTAIHLVLMATLVLCGVAAISSQGTLVRVSRIGLNSAVVLLAVYYLTCLRLTYFKEWRFDSDMERVYGILAYWNHTCGLKEVGSNWRYDASLNFYRTMSGKEPFADFVGVMGMRYPPGKAAYVLSDGEDNRYVSQNHLKVAFHGTDGVLVAIDPNIAKGCEADLPASGVHY